MSRRSDAEKSSPSDGGLRAGELARLAGVSTDTLRHYERVGVLSPPRRRPNGYRDYSPDALDRVRVIRAALAVGFTLEELRAVFHSRAQGRVPCAGVRELAAGKLQAAEEQLGELQRLVVALGDLLRSWDAKLATATPGEPLRLLEALPERDADSAPPVLRRRSTKKR